jgi:hypothetical protein
VAVNRNRQHLVRRPWLFALALGALIGGPILLYFLLPLAGMPIALASGVVAIVALKHLGLLAVLVAPLYALLRRRPRG